MSNEELIAIKDYEGIYSITKIGKVWSYKRWVKNRSDAFRFVGGYWLNPAKDKDGYLIATLKINNKEKKKRVHRLGGQAFILNPLNKPQINHKNGVKADNRVENLEWVTQSENMLHLYATKRRR